MGFDFIVIVPLLPSHCGFSIVFGCGVSFLVSSSVFLLMIVQQLVVILVLLQEGVSARLSTLPSSLLQTLNFFMLRFQPLGLTSERKLTSITPTLKPLPPGSAHTQKKLSLLRGK